MVLKCLKSKNFSFIFKLNEKKKLPLKKLVSRRGYKKGVENIQNRRKGLYKKGVEKKRAGEGCDPQKKLCDDLKAFI